MQFHLLYTYVYSEESKRHTYSRLKLVSNLALPKFSFKKKKN